MRSIKELTNNKPSNAIYAMIDGLYEQDKRYDFEIDIDNFFGYTDRLCFGCAATCALQKVAGKNYKADDLLRGVTPPRVCRILNNFDRKEILSEYLNLDKPEFTAFEKAIDLLRQGCLKPLLAFYSILTYEDNQDLIEIIKSAKLPLLTTENWKEGVHYYRELADKLKEAGY